MIEIKELVLKNGDAYEDIQFAGTMEEFSYALEKDNVISFIFDDDDEKDEERKLSTLFIRTDCIVEANCLDSELHECKWKNSGIPLGACKLKGASVDDLLGEVSKCCDDDKPQYSYTPKYLDSDGYIVEDKVREEIDAWNENGEKRVPESTRNSMAAAVTSVTNCLLDCMAECDIELEDVEIDELAQECIDEIISIWESEEEKFKKNMFYTPKVNQKSLETSLAMLMLLGFIR